MGSRLPLIRKFIDMYWSRMSHVKTYNLIKAQRLYSWYLIEIFNHKEDGLKILEESQNLEIFFKKRRNKGLADFNDGVSEGQEEALVFMTLDEVNKLNLIHFFPIKFLFGLEQIWKYYKYHSNSSEDFWLYKTRSCEFEH